MKATIDIMFRQFAFNLKKRAKILALPFEFSKHKSKGLNTLPLILMNIALSP